MKAFRFLGRLSVTSATRGGTPNRILTFFGDTPRALATDGSTVYVAVFHSGNETTAIFEGVVTIAAGTAAAVLTGGVGTVPAIIAAVVGFIKCCRGIAMWKFANDAEDASEAEKLTKEYKDRAAIRAQILDGMRTLEGILAILGGAIAGNPMLIIFSIAKTVRAICTAVSDYMGDNTKHPVLKKMLDAGAALAHAVEVVSLGGAAGAAIGGAETGAALAGGVMTAAVGGSKAVRAADQIVDQIPEKTGDDAQASESRDRSTSYDAPQASVSYVS